MKSKSVKEILEELWVNCNNVPDDGTIYDPIGVLIDQAIAEINDLITLEKAHLELTLYTDLRKKIKAEMKAFEERIIK